MDAIELPMPELLTGGAVFLAIGAVVWFAFSVISPEKPHAEKRLNEFNRLKRGKESTDDGTEDKRSDALKAVLQRAESLSKPMRSTNEAEISNLKGKLICAGFRSHAALPTFLGIKFICIVVGLVIGGVVSVFFYGLTGAAMIRLAAVTGIALFVPDMVLRFIIGRRLPRQAAWRSTPASPRPGPAVCSSAC